MATTPRRFEWEEVTLLSDSADTTGDTVHFYTGEAQVLYLNDDKFVYRDGSAPDGHWQDFDPSAEHTLQNVKYEFMHVDHPATGTLYIQVLQRTAENDTLYLLRYDYMRDVSDYLLSGNFTLQVDNPITQLNLTIKNIKDSLFTEETTLFLPSSKITWGMAYGDSAINQMCETYLDEVNWKFGSPTVSLSARNNVGFILSSQTFDADSSFSGNATTVLEAILARFGVSKYHIEESELNINIKMKASDTALKGIQTIMDLLSNADIVGEGWNIEEMYDGSVVIGTDSYRRSYIPRGKYTFDDVSKVFQKSISRSIDGAYSHVRVTGKDNNGNALTPVIQAVETWPYWEVGEHRTYHAPEIDGVTQSELMSYAKEIAAQLRMTGRTVSYSSHMKPQLVVGDVVEIPEQGILGTITEVKHTFGEKGFMSSFTLDSGGTIDLDVTGAYTKTRGVDGNNRKKRINDFIQKSESVIQVINSGGGGGGGGGSTVTISPIAQSGDKVADYSIDGVSNSLYANHTYSTSEKVVGKWTDGKPVYEKTIQFTSLSGVSIGVATISEVCQCLCMLKASSDSWWRPIPWLWTNGNSIQGGNWAGGFGIEPSGAIRFQLGSDLGSISKGVLIVRYTKTTD